MNNFGKTFSEKSFQTLSDQIESVGKNCFLPLSFKNKSFFTYINTFSKKLIWDRIESGGNELFLTISCSDENQM